MACDLGRFPPFSDYVFMLKNGDSEAFPAALHKGQTEQCGTCLHKFCFFFFLHGVGIRNETIRAGKVAQ